MQVDTQGFELGDVVRDTITGSQGTIVGICQWLTGCARVSIQGRIDKDGKVPEQIAADVTLLEMVKPGPRHAVDRTKGGPQPRPPCRPEARPR